MALPRPEPGLVVPYAYLWRHEHNRGQEEARKVRPCVIVIATQLAGNGATRVIVSPVTHRPPDDPGRAIELPPRAKRALRLDGERSWVILDEVNRFVWPGFDLRPVPGTTDSFAYGFVPPKFHDALLVRILELVAARRVTEVPRN